MKKEILTIIFTILLTSFIAAAACDIKVELINQDPYPAIPGEYVDVVFQITGIENPECKDTIKFEINENYPFTLDPSEKNPITLTTGIYGNDYGSFYIAPYTLRVDEDALDGNNPLEVVIKTETNELKKFNINIQDTRVDFEVFIKDYDLLTNTLTLEILNTGENDVQAVTITIPKQENIIVKGAPTNIVGDIDSNEYTTADFEATSKGGEIELTVTYTDSINERRTLTKTITFEPEYFKERAGDKNGNGTMTWIIVIVVVLVGWFAWRKFRKKKSHAHR